MDPPTHTNVLLETMEEHKDEIQESRQIGSKQTKSVKMGGNPKEMLARSEHNDT